MNTLSIVLPVAATVLVAALAFVQWSRTERRQARNELATRQALDAEQRRTMAVPFNQERAAVLRALIDTLNTYELNSRWHAGNQDMRAEIPRLNGFLIENRALLGEYERDVARQFLEALVWIDDYQEQRRGSWEEHRRSEARAGRPDPGDYESSWADTRSDFDLSPTEMWEAVRKWETAREILESRLRDVLQGKDLPL